MIVDIIKSAFRNFQALLVLWVIIVLINQIFIFGACFAPYCLVAAIPHTSIIALLINHFFLVEGSSDEQVIKDAQLHERIEHARRKRELLKLEDDSPITLDAKEDTGLETPPPKPLDKPACPECGSIMVKRTARRGRYAGREFYGCSNYPQCTGIINISDSNR